ncbi:MAG: hypothetical protein RLZZ364_176 [Actinomycetota bacterium]|jgi:hypothetical protein
MQEYTSLVALKERLENVSNIFPTTTDDERDPREDQSEDRRREEEIKGDRPPHHNE